MNESYPWDDPEVMRRDLQRAIIDIGASGGSKIFVWDAGEISGPES